MQPHLLKKRLVGGSFWTFWNPSNRLRGLRPRTLTKKGHAWGCEPPTKTKDGRCVAGRDLTICGGCRGYMDIFSEVFCVVSFSTFFFFFTFLHTKKHQRWKKTWSKTERKSKHSAVHSALACLLFPRAAFLNLWHSGRRPCWVRSPEDQRGGASSELCTSLRCEELLIFTILAVFFIIKHWKKYLAENNVQKSLFKDPFRWCCSGSHESTRSRWVWGVPWESWWIVLAVLIFRIPPNFPAEDWTLEIRSSSAGLSEQTIDRAHEPALLLGSTINTPLWFCLREA